MSRKFLLVLLVAFLFASACPAAQQVEKQEVPSADLAKSLAEVQAIFGEKYAEAKKIRGETQRREALRAVVAEILKTHESTTELADRYALLQVAQQIAVQAGQFDAALSVIDTVDAGFRIDALKLKSLALVKISDNLSDPNQHAAIVPRILSLLQEVVRADRFEFASKLSDSALASAKQARDSKLLVQVQSRIRETEKVVAEFQKYRQAIEVLKENPVDPAANRTAGKYLCVYKGDWANGLSHLALCADERLQSVAGTELKQSSMASTATAQAGLGDRWWTLATAADGLEQAAFQNRAKFWYTKALPALPDGGLMRRRIEKRLGESADVPAAPEGLPKFAKNFIGKYIYRASSKDSNQPVRAIWEFREDNQVTVGGSSIANWRVADTSRLLVTPTDEGASAFHVKPRSGTQPITGQRSIQGDTWRWELARLEEKRWSQTTEPLREFGREVGGETEILIFYSNGRINDPFGEVTWRAQGNNLTIDWGKSKRTIAVIGGGGKMYKGSTTSPSGFGRITVKQDVTGRLIAKDVKQDEL